MTDEGASHVALVRETRQQCGIGQRPARPEMPSHQLQPSLDEEGMRCRPNFAGEPTQKLEPAHTGFRGELGQRGRKLGRSVQSLNGSDNGG